MIEQKDTPEYIFEDFLEGLIALDEEEKKEENIHPMFRGMEGAGGIHFWQLQQYIVELAYELLKFQAEFDELEKEWATHKEYWGRYLGTGAIQYARNVIEDSSYENEEFSMDWFANVKENGE